MFEVENHATTPPGVLEELSFENGLSRETQRVKRAVSSTAKRVAEAEELLRKRKRQLRVEQELMVLRKVASERLGGEWSAKNRNAIFDALIGEMVPV